MSFYTFSTFSASFRNPKLICGNEGSRPWQCESCLGVPFRHHQMGSPDELVVFRGAEEELQEVPTHGQHLLVRNPLVDKHGDTAADGLMLQLMQGIALSSLGWGIGPCTLPPVQIACRQHRKLLPHGWASCPSVEALYCKQAKFIVRELLILTLLT